MDNGREDEETQNQGKITDREGESGDKHCPYPPWLKNPVTADGDRADGQLPPDPHNSFLYLRDM